jgi:hypothetical protein
MCRLEPTNQSLLGIILFSMIPIAPCLIYNVSNQPNSHIYVILCAQDTTPCNQRNMFKVLIALCFQVLNHPKCSLLQQC